MILVINQPSRIIITNIHANPGIPIQNQPTGVPSLVPNQRPEKIENYAVLSIFSLICCCFPIGLLASLMSFQVYDNPVLISGSQFVLVRRSLFHIMSLKYKF